MTNPREEFYQRSIARIRENMDAGIRCVVADMIGRRYTAPRFYRWDSGSRWHPVGIDNTFLNTACQLMISGTIPERLHVKMENGRIYTYRRKEPTCSSAS